MPKPAPEADPLRFGTPSVDPEPARFDVSSHRGLLLIESRGALRREDIQAMVLEHYPKHVFERILWDLRRAELSRLRESDLAEIARTARSVMPEQNRRTAYVVSDRRSFAKMCAYLNQSFLAGVRVEYQVFFSVKEATTWLYQAD